MTTTQSISLHRLVQSKANVRRTGAVTGIEALMASIAAHGLRQNLNVRPTTGGRFEVIAGGRRLIALKKLARAGAVPADMPVPCLVLGEADNASEISLAENQLREAMHPDDQCEAFRSLTEDGMPVEDVAARFGVSPAVVRQRLKLAAVAPRLWALYRAGETTLAHMMALTLTDDPAAQERAYAEGGSPAGIRHALTRETLRVDSCSGAQSNCGGRAIEGPFRRTFGETGGGLRGRHARPERGGHKPLFLRPRPASPPLRPHQFDARPRHAQSPRITPMTPAQPDHYTRRSSPDAYFPQAAA